MSDIPHDYIINIKKDKAVGVRLPSCIYDEIKKRADADLRTFNSMLVYLLKGSLEKPKMETMSDRIYKKLLEIEKLQNKEAHNDITGSR